MIQLFFLFTAIVCQDPGVAGWTDGRDGLLQGRRQGCGKQLWFILPMKMSELEIKLSLRGNYE